MTANIVAERCIYCLGEPDGSIEHVIPEALNGGIKIKNATCETCKLTINSQIESQLLGYFWKDLRRAYAYRSKKRGKKKAAQSIPQVTFTLSRKTHPFQKVVPARTHVGFQPLALEGLPAPPFLLKKHPEIPKAPAMNIGAANPIRLNELEEEARKLRVRDPEVLAVTMNFPGTKMGLLPRLVMKIGCGLSWYLHRTYATQACRDMVLNGGDLADMHSFARGVPREFFEIGNDEVRSFLVQEQARDHMYYAFTLLPEALSHVFFFRTGANNIRSSTRA